MKYVCLYNPHSEEWLLFEYIENKELYAPNYGCPIYNGATPEDCITGACEMWDISPEEVGIY